MPGAKQALSHSSSKAVGQGWLFPPEVTAMVTAKPGVGHRAGRGQYSLSETEEEMWIRFSLDLNKAKFYWIFLSSILLGVYPKWMSLLALPLPLPAIFLADYKADKPTKDHRYSHDPKWYFGESKTHFELPQFEF